MIGINVVDRSSGIQVSLNNHQFSLNGSKILVLKTDRDNIQSITQNGEQLVVKLKSGETIIVNDFFAIHDGNKSELVIDDQNDEGTGYWWVEDPANGSDWAQLDTLDPLMIHENTDGIAPWMYWAGAGAALGAAGIAASSGGGGGSDHPIIVDKTPADPEVITNNSNGITGKGTPGSEIVLTKPDGSTEVAVTDKDGNWSFTHNGNPLENGEEGKLVARDPNNHNNTSNEVTTVADTEAPAAPDVSTNNKEGITGKAEGDSTITLTKPDGSTVTTVADADGNWSFPADTLENGAEGHFTATDEAGNTGPETIDVADTQAPDAPVIESNNAAGITGKAEGDSTVTMTKPDGSTVTTVADSDGNWSFAPNPLENGQTGEFTATDKAGNTGESASSTANLDKPSDPVINENNGDHLTGTGDPGTDITLTKPDGSTETTTVDQDGNWSFEPNPLENETEGKVTAKDENGNTSNDVDTGLADTQAPDAPVIESNNAAGITGKAEGDSTVTMTKPDGSTVTTVADSDGNWSFAPNPLENGQTGEFTATDKAGNTGESASSTANLDKPSDPVINENNGDHLTGTGDPGTDITLTKPDGSTETTTVDQDGNWSFEPNPLENETEGKVTAKDENGNTSNDVDTGLADTQAPDAPVIESNNAAGITGKAEGDSTVTMTKPDGSTVTTVADSDGNWSFAPNPLENGQTGEFTATDKAGNTGESASSTANLDKPSDPVINENNGDHLTGTGDPGTDITLTKPDGSTETTTVDQDGNWSFEPNPLENETEGKVTAKDENGNTSNDVDTGLADTQAPDAPVIESNNAAGITGKAEGDSTVTMTKPDGSTVTTVADSDGNWSFAPNPLENGQTGEFTATDKAGNTGESASSTANLDKPSDPVINENNGDHLTGTGDPGTDITLTKPDGSTETTTVDQDGNWSFEPNPLENETEGKVTAKDENGNTSNDVDTGLADTQAPDAPVIETNNAAGITGKAEGDSTVTMTKPDGSTVTTVADSDGNWSFAPNPLENGQTGEFTATDKAGNTGESASSTANLDKPSDPVINENNGDHLTGTGDPGTDITLTKPDGSTETTTVDQDGNWSFAPNPLENDTNGKVTSKDENGNTSNEVDTGLADTQAPDAPIIESNNAAGITGKAEGDSTVTMTKPDGSTVTTVADSDGNWSFAPNPLENGQTGEFTATDKAGNTGESASSTANLDKPSDPVINENNGDHLTGTGDPGTDITLTKPDGSTETTTVDQDGNWSFEPNPLENETEGKVTAKDENGNTSNDVDTGLADTQAPDAPVIESNNAAGITGKAEGDSTVTMTKPDGSTVTTVADSDGNWSFAPNPLENGQTGEFTATDKAGNTGESASSTANLDKPSDPVINENNGDHLTGTGDPGTDITLTKPDGSTETTTVDQDGNWSFEPNPLENETEGKVTAKDENGNTSNDVDTGLADTQAPDAPVIESNNAAGITGKAEGDSTVTMTKPDGSTVTTVADSDGNWSFAPNPLENGQTGEFTATDKAGNTGESASSTANLDKPSDPVINENNGDHLTGTGDPGTDITLTKPDGSTETTTVDQDGNWSFEPNPLENETEGKVTAKDENGNTSNDVDTGLADTQAPDAPVIESNNAAGITGKAEGDSTVTMTKPDGSTVTTVADSDGNWSFAPNPLENGQTGEFTATDKAGNTGESASSTANLDKPSDPVINENNGDHLTGTGDPGTDITLTKPDGSTETTTVDQDGNWSFEPNPLENETEGKVTAKDENGNTSNDVDTGLADTQAPDAPIIESNNAAGITGKAEAGSTVTLTKPDGTTATTEAGTDGSWSFAPNPLENGERGEFTATDAAGNTSESASSTANLDKPSDPVINENNGDHLTGTGDPGTDITLTKPDGSTETTTVDQDGNWSFEPNPLENETEGKVTAKDENGNTSNDVDTGLADTQAPDAPVIESNNAAGITGKAEGDSTVTMTKPDGSTVTTVADSDGNWSFAPNPLENGQTGEFTATDKAGNTGESASSTANLDKPSDPVINENNGDHLTGTGDPGTDITLTKPDGSTETTTVDQDGNWSFEPNPLENETEGKVTAKDENGNTSNDVDTGLADTQAPDAPVIESNNAAGITGKAEGDSTVTMTKPDGSTVTTVADSDGNWSFAPNPLENGQTGEFTATDKAGNTGESASSTANLDKPSDPVINENNGDHLTGTGDPGTDITLTKPDGSTETTTVDQDGNWSFEPNPLENETEGKVTAKDENGNTSNDVDTGLADTQAPDAPVIESNNAAGITGKAEGDSTVTMTKPDGSTVTTVADSDGNWSFAPNPLENGQTGEFTATDKAGNTGESASSTANLDKPSDPVINENNGDHLTGTGDPGTDITLTKPDGSTETTTVDQDGNWSFEPNPLENETEGKVTAKDENGNTSNDVDTGLADTQAPDAPVIESNNAAGITGKAEGDSTVTMTKPDGSTVTTVADSDGNWSFAPNPLENGQTGEFTATDKAGNTGESASSTANLDKPSDPVINENNGDHLTGTGDPGTDITLTKPDGSTETTTVDQDGNWSFEPNPLENETEGKVTAKDENGNTSNDVDTGLADTQAPDAPVIESNNAAGITGKAEGDSTVTMTKPDGSTVTTVADSDGNWSFAPNPLENGQTGEFTATDKAGNTGESASSTANLDKPSDPVINENNGDHLTGTGDPGTDITLTKPDGSTETTTVDQDGNWSFEPNPLENETEGKVTAKDENGNTSNDVDTGLADTQAPDAPVIESNNAAGITGKAEGDSTVTMTKPDGSTVTTVADSDGNWSFAPNPLENGQTGEFTATDKAGNTGESASSTANLDKPSDPVINENNGDHLTGTGDPGTDITLTKPDGSTETTTVDQDGNWSFEPNPLENETEGKVTAKDENGNTSNDVDTGLADTQAPDAPVIESNNAAGITGKAEGDSTVTMTKPDGSTVTTVADSDGNWSFAPNPLENGQTGEFTATDKAGNTGESASSTANLDKPSDPVINENNGDHLTGTGDPGTDITLTKPDGSTETTTVDQDGNWSFEPNPLENETEGKVTAKDENGNTSNEVDTGLADTQAPDAPVIESNNAAGITGKAEGDSTVTMTKPDGSTVTTVADSDGNWSFAPNPLENGQTGEFTATDKAGNTGESASSTANLDKPSDPVINENNGDHLTGTGDPGTDITLTKPDGSTETTTVDQDGNWSFEPNPLENETEGKVTAKDENGNTSNDVDTGLADTQAPDAPVIESNNAAGITGKAEAGSTVTLTKPDGTTATTEAGTDGSWSFAPNPLENGERGEFTATDAAGNTGGSASSTADTVAPDAPVIEANNAAGITGTTNEGNSTITLTKPDGSTVTTVADADGNWSFPAGTLEDGEKGEFTATDSAGNTGGSASSTADTVVPDTPVVESNNAAGITGKADGGSTVTVTKPDGSTVTTIADGDGNWSFPVGTLEDGEKGEFTATDPAGNTGGSASSTADTVAPDAPVIESNNAAGITGKAEGDSTVTMTKPDGSTVTTVADADGNWSFPAGTLEDGEKGEFTATDSAGNTGGSASSTADTVVPDTPVVESNNAAGITGKADGGSTVTVTKPDGSTVTTIADGDGNWSFPVGTLEDGEKGEFTATDPAGNTGGSASSTADTVAPDAPVIESNNAAGITGKAEGDSTVTMTKPDGSTVTTVADADGNWSFPVGTLEDGEKGEFTATDAAGNTGGSASSTADTVAPDAPIIESNNAAGITGTTNEGNSTITLTKPDGSTVTTVAEADGSWSFPAGTLENGAEGHFTATDEAGNTGPETIDVADTLAPDAPVINGVYDDVNPDVGNISNNGFTNDKQPTISGTAESGSTVTIYYTDPSTGQDVVLGTVVAEEGVWTFTPTTELPVDGSYIFKATATDGSGNTSDYSNEYNVNVDTSLPDDTNLITIDSISEDTGIYADDYVTNDQTLVFNGSFDKPLQSNEEVRISLDGGVTWFTATILDGNKWTYDNTANILDEGSYEVVVRITTKSGNYDANSPMAEQPITIDITGSDEAGLGTSFNITTDTSAGLVAGDEYSHSQTSTNDDLITRDQTVTISGVLTADLAEGNYLQISGDNGLTWTTVSVTDKAWSYALPEFNASSVEHFDLRVVDVAGNVASGTNFSETGYDVVIDLDSPEGISLAPIVPDNPNTATTYTYDSSVYGKVEAGAIVSLVNDVNKDGRYNEGVDTIVGFATADEEGNWSIKTTLPAGSSQLGFVVWDAAGNNSGLSTTSSIGTIEGDGSKIYEEYTLNWGSTSTTAYGGSNASALGLQNGQWTFLQTVSGYNTIGIYGMKDSVTDVNNAIYDYQTLNTANSSVTQGGDFGINISSITFADLDRNGYDDIIGQKSATTPQADGSVNAPIWYQTSAGSYEIASVVISTQIYQHLGGTIVFDRTGDGWLDVVMSNSEANYQNHPVAIMENDGTGTLNLTTYTGIPGMSNTGDGNLQYSSYWNLTFLHEISGVDLNNDGAVDIVGHTDISEQYNYTDGNLSRYLTVLYNNAGNTDATTDFTEESFNNIFTNDGYIDYSDLVASMVWADFNGDGYLDLFISRGANAAGTANSTESRIYLNDGTGHLLASDSNDALWFGDRLDGGTSIAVDWNHDGLMDILEVPRQQVGGSAVVYLNTGDNVWNNPSQQIKIGNTTSGFSGAVTADYDWDGAVDLILYRPGASNSSAGSSILIRNTNAVADGTALHLRIVDAEGFNVFFGNTVNLYNSKGELVSTQVINAQSSGFNDSTGLLHFYGLDPNETYSVQLLRVDNGVVNHVGSGNNYGGYDETTINSTWGNLKPGNANESFVLTAEGNGESHNTAGAGITGTGYNDTFFAAEGDRTYDGSGGWETSMTGKQVWKTDGGLDVVDYSNSTGGITADLSTGVSTGFGNHTLINIEGLVGSKYDDVFTDNASNNTFEGGAGNDTFNLVNGGNDTLIYKVLVDTDGTGGNGSDTVNGFAIGNIMVDQNADIINIKDLLNYDGTVSFYLDDGEKKLDYNSKEILDYIKVESNGTDTIISIDRDGSGTGHDFTVLVTLKDTDTDLLTLLSNNQIVV